MVQPGTVYTIGRMPDLYEAVGTLANSPTMWYNWTAPANGFATVAVLNNDTGASNAFICAMGQGSSSANFTALSSNYVSSTIAVVGGQEYQMGIYQYDLASTNFQVDLSFVPEPANDNFANAYLSCVHHSIRAAHHRVHLLFHNGAGRACRSKHCVVRV